MIMVVHANYDSFITSDMIHQYVQCEINVLTYVHFEREGCTVDDYVCSTLDWCDNSFWMLDNGGVNIYSRKGGA